MPTNVTAEYKKAEQAFRQARDPHERLVCLKEMLRTLPKHKGTEHLQADIRSRIKRAERGARRLMRLAGNFDEHPTLQRHPRVQTIRSIVCRGTGRPEDSDGWRAGALHAGSGRGGMKGRGALPDPYLPPSAR